MGNVALNVDTQGNISGGESGEKSEAILQDLDVLDLTDSLTKTLVHGELRGKEGSLRDSESLQELDQDDLAAILPDVSTSSSCNEPHSLLSGLDSTDSQHTEADHYSNVDDMICNHLVRDTLAAMVAVDHDVSKQRNDSVPTSPSGGTDGSNKSRVSGNVFTIKLSDTVIDVECNSRVREKQQLGTSGNPKHAVETNVGGKDSLENGIADKKPTSSRHSSSLRAVSTHNTADNTRDARRNNAGQNHKVMSPTVKSKPNRHKSKSNVSDSDSLPGDSSGSGSRNSYQTDSRKRRPLSIVKLSRKSPLQIIDDAVEQQQSESVECLLRIDTASNVSPDSGIQSSSGSPNTPDSPHLSLSTSPQHVPGQSTDSQADASSVLDEQTVKHSTKLSPVQCAPAGDSTENGEDVTCHVKLKKAKQSWNGSTDDTETSENTESVGVDPNTVLSCGRDQGHVTVTGHSKTVSEDALVSCVTSPEFDANSANKVAAVKRTNEGKHSKISVKDRKSKSDRKQKRSMSTSRLPEKEQNGVNVQCLTGDTHAVIMYQGEDCSGSITKDDCVLLENVNNVDDIYKRLSPSKSGDGTVPSVVSAHLDAVDGNSMSSEDTPLAFIKNPTWKTKNKEQDTSAEELCPVKKKKKPGRHRRSDVIPSQAEYVADDTSTSTVPGTMTSKCGIRSCSVDKVEGHTHTAHDVHVPHPGRPRKHPRLDAETVLRQLRLVAQQKSRLSKPRSGRPCKHRRRITTSTGSSPDAVAENNFCEALPRTELSADCGGTQTADWCNPITGLQQQIKVKAPINGNKPKRGRPKGTTKKKSRNVLHKPVRRTNDDVLPRAAAKSRLGLMLGANAVNKCKMAPAKSTPPAAATVGSDSTDDAVIQEEPVHNNVMNIFDKFLTTSVSKNSPPVDESNLDDSAGVAEPGSSKLPADMQDKSGVGANGTVVKRKRGRPRKIPLTAEQIAEQLATLNTYSQMKRGAAKSRVDLPLGCNEPIEKLSGDRELDSLVQSVQDSIDSQFDAGEEDLTELDNNRAHQAVSMQEAPSLSSVQPQTTGSLPPQGAGDDVSQWRNILDGVRRWKSVPRVKKDKMHRANLKVFHRRRRRKRRKMKSVSDVVAESVNHDDHSSDDLSVLSLPKLTNMTASPRKESQHRANSWSGPCLSVEVDGTCGSIARSGGYVSGELAFDDEGSDAAALGSMPTLSPNSTASMPEIPPRPPLLRLEDFMRRRRRRKLKHFKSKHRNIFDPIFLAEVDHLVQELNQLRICESDVSTPFVVPEKVALPAAFNLSWQLVKRRHHREMHLRRMKPLGLDRRGHGVGLSREKGRKGFRRKNLTTENAGERLDLVTPEQCLPLKKRHKLMTATQVTGIVASARTNESGVPLSTISRLNEKRKVGRPRKHPLPVVTVSPQKIMQPGELQLFKCILYYAY